MSVVRPGSITWFALPADRGIRVLVSLVVSHDGGDGVDTWRWILFLVVGRRRESLFGSSSRQGLWRTGFQNHLGNKDRDRKNDPPCSTDYAGEGSLDPRRLSGQSDLPLALLALSSHLSMSAVRILMLIPSSLPAATADSSPDSFAADRSLRLFASRMPIILVRQLFFPSQACY